MEKFMGSIFQLISAEIGCVGNLAAEIRLLKAFFIIASKVTKSRNTLFLFNFSLILFYTTQEAPAFNINPDLVTAV